MNVHFLLVGELTLRIAFRIAGLTTFYFDHTLQIFPWLPEQFSQSADYRCWTPVTCGHWTARFCLKARQLQWLAEMPMICHFQITFSIKTEPVPGGNQ
eukprot:161253-Rhodomonas_salina.1